MTKTRTTNDKNEKKKNHELCTNILKENHIAILRFIVLEFLSPLVRTFFSLLTRHWIIAAFVYCHRMKIVSAFTGGGTKEMERKHTGRGKLNIHKSKANEKDEKFLSLHICDIARFRARYCYANISNNKDI